MNAIRAINGAEADRTSLTPYQNRSILIAGLTCACFSFVASLVTLRWFILMKRSYRHRLIMYLVISDTFKALWYFVFPVVTFSRGLVQSSSGFCQASGFFLATGIEASDFAILMIALHSLIYIFRPPARSGDEGGLYPYRWYIYPFWIALPVLAASLAFINSGPAYTTAGTFCYLPRRPFWYRIALSWIPRYCILSLIFGMYGAVYIYVVLKFRSFSALQDSDSEYSSNSQSRRSSSESTDDIAPDEPSMPPHASTNFQSPRPLIARLGSYNNKPNPAQPISNPWDEVSFITSKGLRQSGVAASDFAGSHNPSLSNESAFPLTGPFVFDQNPAAEAPSSIAREPIRGSQLTGSTIDGPGSPIQPNHRSSRHNTKVSQGTHMKPMDPLKRTRKAIRKQLRYLFIYPAVYVLMWVFPLASHCLLYNDYYVRNPIYWLSILTTCCFSLQAGVDCIVFSWREKPWRRIPDERKLSFQRVRTSFMSRGSIPQNRSAGSSVSMENSSARTRHEEDTIGRSSQARSTMWWEAEGLKRKDSVWMGTDMDRKMTLAQIPSSDPVIEEEDDGPRSSREQRHQRERSLSPSSKLDTNEKPSTDRIDRV